MSNVQFSPLSFGVNIKYTHLGTQPLTAVENYVKKALKAAPEVEARLDKLEQAGAKFGITTMPEGINSRVQVNISKDNQSLTMPQPGYLYNCLFHPKQKTNLAKSLIQNMQDAGALIKAAEPITPQRAAQITEDSVKSWLSAKNRLKTTDAPEFKTPVGQKLADQIKNWKAEKTGDDSNPFRKPITNQNKTIGNNYTGVIFERKKK